MTLPSETWDCGLVYFTRHYRIRPGISRPPLNQIASARAMLPSLVILWLPADNGTAMLAEAVLAEDALLKRVHRADCFEAVARSVPAIEPWLACADPMTEVFGMGALQNTLRRVVQDGRPLVLGLHLVGDAACTTNPTLARGLSLAAAGARQVARVIGEEPDDLVAQALRLEQFVAAVIEPSFRENARYDRALARRLRADLAGQPAPPPPPSADTLRPEELLVAGMADPDLYRAYMRYFHLLASRAALSDPALVERVRRLVPPGAALPTPAGPTRADLARLLAAS